jgi:protein-tyrosine phosphatase
MSRSQAVLQLDGAMNCRDLGGYPTPEGKTVRTGALFRSDRLSELTEDDLEELSSYGIRTVVDFRTEAEAGRDRTRLWASVTTHAPLPIGDEIAQQHDFLERLKLGEVTEVTHDDVAESYREILDDHHHQYQAFMTLATDVDHLPLLFHCTAGKDRTGVAAAIILEACGVERVTVLDDYELTNELRAHRRIEQLRPSLEEAGVDVEAVRPALSAPRPAMELALEHLDTAHGGAVGYIVNTLGLGHDGVETLRANLLI